MMRSDGQLGFPGGIIDPGEDIVQGLNRECVEEIGADLQVTEQGTSNKVNDMIYDLIDKFSILRLPFLIDDPARFVRQIGPPCICKGNQYGKVWRNWKEHLLCRRVWKGGKLEENQTYAVLILSFSGVWIVQGSDFNLLGNQRIATLFKESILWKLQGPVALRFNQMQHFVPRSNFKSHWNFWKNCLTTFRIKHSVLTWSISWQVWRRCRRPTTDWCRDPSAPWSPLKHQHRQRGSWV